MNISWIHAIHGFKTALAAVLAYLVTVGFDLELGYWAVISTVIVMQVYVADSVALCLYRFSGTLVGALMGTVVLMVIPDSPMAVGAALFVTIGFCSFLTFHKPRYRMAAITVVILVMTGMHADNTILFGLSRVFEILIGILSAFLVSVLVFPRTRAGALTQRLESQSKVCSEKCVFLVDAFIRHQENVADTLVDDLVKEVWDNHELLLKIRQHEALIFHGKLRGDHSQKVWILNRFAEHLRNMVRALNAMEGGGHDILLSKELGALARESGRFLILLVKGQNPCPKNLESRITVLDSKLTGLREKGLIRRFDSKRLVQVFSFYSSLLYLAEDLVSGAKNFNNGPDPFKAPK